MPIFEIVLIFALAFAPPLFSWWYLRKVQGRVQTRLRAARDVTTVTPIALPPPPLELGWIGETTCRFNARSPYLRCAVNPEGPCEGCRLYQARE